MSQGLNLGGFEKYDKKGYLLSKALYYFFFWKSAEICEICENFYFGCCCFQRLSCSPLVGVWRGSGWCVWGGIGQEMHPAELQRLLPLLITFPMASGFVWCVKSASYRFPSLRGNVNFTLIFTFPSNGLNLSKHPGSCRAVGPQSSALWWGENKY